MTDEGQLSTGIPGIRAYITGHDDTTGKAVLQESRTGIWKQYDNKLMAFNVVYTTSEFPANLNDQKDVAAHDKLIASEKLGLVNPGGTVCRVVDFAPGGFECMMHRTQSLDFGIVLEGTIDLVLDSGDIQTMKRGDVAVQRATMHSWRNNHPTDWARMIFVLQDCQPVNIGGQAVKEDLGRGTDGLPPSGNDA